MNAACAGLSAVMVALNLWSFALFWYDKRQALRGGWRIRESRLLILAGLGGWAGMILGRRLLRHKTRKQPFSTHLLLLAGIETGCLAGWIALGRPLPSVVSGAMTGG